MESLIRCGLLRVRTKANEWLLLDGQDSPSLLDSYVVSFTHFHEHRFVAPPHRFLLGLLHYYMIGLHHAL
jgi:hypothetical protein